MVPAPAATEMVQRVGAAAEAVSPYAPIRGNRSTANPDEISDLRTQVAEMHARSALWEHQWQGMFNAYEQAERNAASHEVSMLRNAGRQVIALEGEQARAELRELAGRTTSELEQQAQALRQSELVSEERLSHVERFSEQFVQDQRTRMSEALEARAAEEERRHAEVFAQMSFLQHGQQQATVEAGQARASNEQLRAGIMQRDAQISQLTQMVEHMQATRQQEPQAGGG